MTNKPTLHSIAKMIDHSLLHPTMTDQELTAGCRLALHHNVASVCIKPYAVPLASNLLKGSDVAVGTVIGFPHGNSQPAVKLLEAERALSDGATELDMVVNIGKVLSSDWNAVSGEIRLINELVTSNGALLKVIFENDFLPQDEFKVHLCHLCSEHGVAFVKTSTGYGFVKGDDGRYSYQGATDHDLALMRRESAPEVRVKAAGGVRTLDDLLRVRTLGVTRVGATATEAILAEARARGMG
ncbi:MAG: deoxyribose-phosphate aldolase [Chloroflexota bacterium]|nr:deoxyribose-phosphate aldolase [Chloroflexota bacterium]